MKQKQSFLAKNLRWNRTKSNLSQHLKTWNFIKSGKNRKNNKDLLK